jgi:hypothetical protein
MTVQEVLDRQDAKLSNKIIDGVVNRIDPLIRSVIEARDQEKIISQQATEIAMLREHMMQLLVTGRAAFMACTYSKEASKFLEQWARASMIFPGFK